MTLRGIFRTIFRTGPGASRARLLAWSTIAGLVFGAISFGEPLEDVLRIGRNAVRRHPASGNIVVVAIDDRSLAKFNDWPWPRRRYAPLIENLQRAGARRIFFDIIFSTKSDRDNDAAFAHALAQSSGTVTLAVHDVKDQRTGSRYATLPQREFARHAALASINFPTRLFGWVWDLPYVSVVGGKSYPSFAAKLARVSGVPDHQFLIDYSINPRTVPTISASDVLEGRFRASDLAGKDVLVAMIARGSRDLHRLPGYGYTSGAYVHALGAETLRSGHPLNAGWLPAFFMGLALAVAMLRMRNTSIFVTAFGTGLLCLLIAPLATDNYQIAVEVVPAIFLIGIVAASRFLASFYRAYQARGTVNLASGLLNLDGLRRDAGDHRRMLIAARIHNFAQIASTFPADEEQALIAQIASRLTLGTANQKLYQGDEGIFAWFTDEREIAAVGDHLDALHGFFRNSLVVADRQVDLAISFGLDTGGDRSLTNRLSSALVACDEAAAEGLRWKAYDPASLENASWKLSLLGQLDRAIDNGDFWVAYQPKLDLATGKIYGAEALARWTHPQKGPIAPLDFILAAEQNDRIAKLTTFVLQSAIKAAAGINAAGMPFNIAVNLSTRLIGDLTFASLVCSLLEEHGLAPNRLTLEVTETATLSGGSEEVAMLAALRRIGVGISIDDYGTGLSTLEYLKKIPANEIKIDQSFVAAIIQSPSDRLMVHSTIQLVHSLGHKVVAEGVEDQATLDALARMGCDYAQGFFISRPISLAAMVKTLWSTKERPIVQHLNLV